MNDHPIQGLMTTVMQSIKEMVDVNTIIGDPITTIDGVTIIPVSGGLGSPRAAAFLGQSAGPKLFSGGAARASTSSRLSRGDRRGKAPKSANAGTVDRIVTLVPSLSTRSSHVRQEKPALPRRRRHRGSDGILSGAYGHSEAAGVCPAVSFNPQRAFEIFRVWPTSPGGRGSV